MGIRLDIHLHTRKHSSCSLIDEHQLIRQAVKKGLDGIVITEHHYQWRLEDLEELAREADEPGFLVLAGFEYTSSQGDILIYGLEFGQIDAFERLADPVKILEQARALGAACVAAHPTRAAMSFDERIIDMPFDAIEVESTNLQPHEQRLAKRLAANLGLPSTSASDAHRLEDVGAYALEFDALVRTVADLRDAIKGGRFRSVGTRQ